MTDVEFDEIGKAIEVLREYLAHDLLEQDMRLLETKLKDFSSISEEAERTKLALEMVKLIRSYPKAYAALKKQLKTQTQIQSEAWRAEFIKELRSAVDRHVRSLAERANLAGSSVSPSIELVLDSIVFQRPNNQERKVIIKKGGLDGAKSHKIANFRFVPNNMVDLFSGPIMAAAGAPTPWLVAAAIWGVIHYLWGATTIDMDEERASVLWGIILARRGTQQIAEEAEIEQRTNAARLKDGLIELKPQRIQYHLEALKEDKVIKRAVGRNDAWQLIESYAVVSSDRAGWRLLERIME